jgi:MoaA/NifB/PqqE/SkfB family radical SAM enzyme
MLPRLAFRFATELSPRLAAKAGYLWAYKGMRALTAYKRRVRRGELFPPFLFLALTSACNLRCHGCWIESKKSRELSLDDIESVIAADETARRVRQAGNVTPLVSIDGLRADNDDRRGEGVFDAAMAGLGHLKRHKILYGVATTVTGRNFSEVLSDAYVEHFIQAGAMYLWYYVFRPVGADPSPEFCVSREQMIELRKRLLGLRRKHPILLIDTYWNAAGEAVCPAAKGLGFHIGPGGHVEPCPPLSFACETIRDHGGDLFKTINESQMLRGFQQFVSERTKGCVILERPQELAAYFESMSAIDSSGRNAYEELAASKPRTSHDLPGEEIPEDYWFYRLLKKQLFFGMGAYG